MSRTSFEPDRGGAYWLVLTPSVDDVAWRRELERAVEEAGLKMMSLVEGGDAPDYGNPDLVILTDDALAPMIAGAGPGRVAAVMPEPGTAHEKLEDKLGIVAPQSVWHSSILLARAMDLAPLHRVVTAAELARRPQSIRLLDRFTIRPPRSAAELPRRPAIHAAFLIYDSVQPRQEPVHWSDRLFTYDERATRDASDWGVLDITGRPRMLVYGPYLALPPGMWRARIRFGVDKDAAGHQYRVDWGTRTACVSEYVTPGAPGIYEIDLDFEWTSTDAAEIRLILTEGSFMGTLLFQGMTVARTPGTWPTPDRAAA